MINYLRISLVILLFILLPGCATHQSQVTPRYVEIPNGKLEYYSLGKGTPVVLVSGYLSDASSWNKYFIAALAKKHQVIVFNNRNVGRSYVDAKHYHSKDLARDTYYLIEKLNLHKPTIIGISMGGMIAQDLATLYPDKIGSLVLINTAISGDKSIRPSEQTQKTMLEMPMDKLGRYFVAVKLYFPPSERTKMGIALIKDRFKPAYYSENDPSKVFKQQRHLILQWGDDNDTADKLKNLKVPTLVLNGTADQVIPPINSVILANTIPNAKLQRWPNGGHAMIYQYPDSIAEAINQFI